MKSARVRFFAVLAIICFSGEMLHLAEHAIAQAHRHHHEATGQTHEHGHDVQHDLIPRYNLPPQFRMSSPEQSQPAHIALPGPGIKVSNRFQLPIERLHDLPSDLRYRLVFSAVHSNRAPPA